MHTLNDDGFSATGRRKWSTSIAKGGRSGAVLRLALLLAAGVMLSAGGQAHARSGKSDQKASDHANSDQQTSQKPPRLLRNTVLRATREYVIWSVGGSTKVGRDRFHIPDKQWVNGKLQPTPDRATVRVDQVRQAGQQAIELSAAGDEYEPVQVVITPRRGDLKVGKVEVSDLTGEHGRIPAKQVSVRLVGYLWGRNPTQKGYYTSHGHPKKNTGPYPDPLLPEGSQTVAKKGRNYTLYLEAHVPPQTPPGDYRGQVMLHVNGKSLKPLPLRLHVWDFTLPHQTPVAGQLLSLDGPSLRYWYEAAPWEAKYRQVVKAFLSDMANHRFSPASTPPLQRVHWRNFPVQVEGKSGKAMDFKDGRTLKLGGPRFDKLADHDGFTVGLWLRTSRDDLPHLLMHDRWNAGYKLVLDQGKLTGTIELGTVPGKPHGWGRHNAPSTKKLTRIVEAPYPNDGRWHHVAFAYKPGALTLFIDGKQTGRQSIDRKMAIGYVLPNLHGEGFQIDELRWIDHALSADQIRQHMSSSSPGQEQLATYSFDQPKYDFAARVEKGDPAVLDRQHMFKWADWAGEHGLYINNIREKPPGDASLAQIKRYDGLYWQPLRERDLLHLAYMRLPNDEASSGARGKQNREWAKKVRQVAPNIKLHQTFDGMGGSRTSHDEKLKRLKPFVGLVDIWSMRPDVFTDVKDFFESRVAAGDTISIYIHKANAVEMPTVLNAARTFFWLLNKYHVSAYTLWRINLWFMPRKRGGHLPYRKLWRVPWGYKLTLRNFSLTDGMLYYPGKNGPVDSLRTEVWRDGTEDYEYLARLRTLVGQARKAGRDNMPAVRSARAVLKEVGSFHPTNPLWKSRPTTDTSRLLDLRRRAARAIEQLQRAQPAG